MKCNLMWMAAGLLIGCTYSSYKKDIDKMMNEISNAATKKVTDMVGKM